MSPILRGRICFISAVLACVSIAGCTWWQTDSETGQLKWKEVFGTDGPEIVNARQPMIETVVLHVAHVEQPLSDISMIDLLWKEVDQIGAFDAETRRELESSGIRVGITGPTPPPLLESMMKADSRWRRQRTDGQFGSNEQRIPIFSGESSSLKTGDTYEQITVRIPRGEESEEVVYESASCRFRITAEKVQDGWVNLQFIPEIHHGSTSLRRVATEDGWKLNEGQSIVPIYSRKFSLTLNKGEIALLTATENTASPGSLGYSYFIGDGKDDQMQRVIIIKLEQVQKARPRLSREG